MLRRTKRLLCYIVSLLMLVPVLGGCTTKTNLDSENPDQADITGEVVVEESWWPEEKITLTAFWPIPPNVLKFITDFNEASIYPVLEEQTNIHIEWQHGNEEQYSLMINSGDITDIVYAPGVTYAYPGGGEKAVADGSFLKLNDYLVNYGPNYTRLIETSPSSIKDSRTDSGTIWRFNMFETEIQGAFLGMTVRKDWLDDLGIDTPETYDDWRAMLVKFRDEKGASAPLLLPQTLFSQDGDLVAGYGIGKAFYQVDGKVSYGPVQPGFKKFITMLAEWYKAGLIDKDFATRDADSLNQLKYTQQTGAWNEGFWMFNFNKNKAEDADVFQQYAVTSPVENRGESAHLRQVNYNVRDEWAAVSAKSKHPIEAVKWIDNLYSEENYVLTNYGIEGEGYTKNGDAYELTPLITKNPDGLVMAEALYRYTMHDGPMWRKWDRESPGWTEDEKAAEAIWNKSDATYVIPKISMTADEAQEFTTIMGDINTYVTETCVRYVMGLEDLNSLDGFQEDIKSMGIDRAITIQQNALDRYNER